MPDLRSRSRAGNPKINDIDGMRTRLRSQSASPSEILDRYFGSRHNGVKTDNVTDNFLRAVAQIIRSTNRATDVISWRVKHKAISLSPAKRDYPIVNVSGIRSRFFTLNLIDVTTKIAAPIYHFGQSRSIAHFFDG